MTDDAASKEKRGYNDGIGSAIHERFPLPDNIAISSVELLTYFPKHAALWPELILRLVRNDFGLPYCAVRQLYARGNLDKPEYDRRYASLRKAIKTAGDRTFADSSFTLRGYKSPPASHPDLQPYKLINIPTDPDGRIEDLYHINKVLPPAVPPPYTKLSKTHATLFDLANGVVNHPPPGQQGVLTKCILWALENSEAANYDTSNLMEIVKKEKFVPDAGAGTLTWDQDGCAKTQEIDRP
ncbi:hypothetical protein DOTSEDRAFT_31507 [Dothistroma septosporum NZE10]|uniref:Uncharacterized protein n=1 Tax=Dothistroma septosporum (strain NZE10 / CBS 128990) TaxID=675120 RepID=N1PVM1_DOTSN|nr:hypothetical protein DOTSEDRAFT_31507 [Dothistroma septosporum NZE10]